MYELYNSTLYNSAWIRGDSGLTTVARDYSGDKVPPRAMRPYGLAIGPGGLGPWTRTVSSFDVFCLNIF